MSVRYTPITVLNLLAWSALTWAGPDWEEITDGGTDAGALPQGAQKVAGLGALNSISGSLNELGFAPGDYQDMYLISVVTPTSFTAATTLGKGGFADFDTQLWLFEYSGVGLVANDDDSIMTTLSVLRPVATDGSGAIITTPGLYYLAISGFNSDPLSISGPIFDQVLPTEVSGPDGPGGTSPVLGWDAAGATGNYLIKLTGAAFVETCVGDIDISGTVDSADLALLLGSWGVCGGCSADLDGDGEVNPVDLASLLGSWGPCFPV